MFKFFFLVLFYLPCPYYHLLGLDCIRGILHFYVACPLYCFFIWFISIVGIASPSAHTPSYLTTPDNSYPETFSTFSTNTHTQPSNSINEYHQPSGYLSIIIQSLRAVFSCGRRMNASSLRYGRRVRTQELGCSFGIISLFLIAFYRACSTVMIKIVTVSYPNRIRAKSYS